MKNNGKRELNEKQKLFVKEYIVDYNATQAYIRAGYSQNGAKESACKLLTNTHIQEAVSRAGKKVTNKIEVTIEQVLNMLLKEADYYGPGSTQSARVQAITQVGRYLSMFSDNTNINLTGLAERMRDAEKRITVGKKEKKENTSG